MEDYAYTMKKKNNTDELHIFKSKLIKESEKGKCEQGKKSMCKAMDKKDKEGNNIFTCEDEQRARILAAKQGRKVCGNCVAQLYTTYR